MSAVDAPPGIAFDGRASGEFVARTASMRLARRALWVVLAASAITLMSLGKRRFHSASEIFMIGPVIAIGVALVGHAVRRARLRIDGNGVRWGWDDIGFRIARESLARATGYDDAIAFVRPGGSPWYLARYDLDDFDRVPTALRAAGIPFERAARKAPWRARLQTYGVALDGLLVLDALFALGVLALAYA